MRVEKHFTIYKKKDFYNTFPNVVSTNDGLLMSFRSARCIKTTSMKDVLEISHVDTTSRALCIFSSDQGENWSKPEVMYDDFIAGVQDPFLTRLKDGVVVGVFFQWRIYRQNEVPLYSENSYLLPKGYVPVHDGTYCIRSFDNGKTWDSPTKIIVNENGREISTLSTRGNIVELDNGDLVLATQEFFHNRNVPRRAILVKSSDRGLTWEFVSTIAEKPDRHFGEIHLHRTDGGKLVAFLRTNTLNAPFVASKAHFLSVAYSCDDGRTWGEPQQCEVYSACPYFPLKLSNNKVMLVYGYRNEPFGIRCKFLNPECDNINEAQEMVIRDDLPGFDIGYTSAVEVEEGKVLVVYYTYDEDDATRYIAGSYIEID